MKFSLRTAGWATVASGVAGIVAYGFLMQAVFGRSSGALTQAQYVQAFNNHDAAAMFQFLFLLPFAFVVYKLSQDVENKMSRSLLYVGVISISLVSFTLLLVFPGVLSNGIYTLPQGVFGVWLVVVCWRSYELFPRALRWFGMIVGTGLVIFSFFLIGYTLLVDPINFRIPAATVEEFESIPWTEANAILHQFIWVGSLMGVLPLPFWTLFAGAKLLRLQTSDARERALVSSSID